MQQGQYIDGRYKIIKNIGSGGMANVFLATDLILERDVAIKVMRYDFSNDSDNIRRFNREAMATTELNHQNIVPVFDVGEDEDYYIVMEYVDGLNLKEYIQEKYPIPYHKVIDIMSQVLSGVEYAHSKGIIHRDLKPHNILLNQKEQVMITDFGIAVALTENSITQTNSLLGSVQYISPEQAKGSISSVKSDIYSLGIILFEMLSKEVPFDGESAVSIALQHFQKEIPSLRTFDPDLPQALENVVIKATAKDPRHRYSTAAEMRKDLMTSLRPERSQEEKYVIPIEKENLEETIQMKPITAAVADPSLPKTYSTEKPGQEQAVERVEETPQPPVNPVPYEPEKRKKGKPWWVIFALLIIGFSLIIFYVTSQPATIRIPDVKGMTEQQAVRTLEGLNLNIGEIQEEPSEDYDRGEVTRTSPQVNSSVKERAEIYLFISSGQELYPVPDLVGQDIEKARQELNDIGFTVEEEGEASSEYEEGRIISQNIQPGEEVLPSETTILLTVSTGEPAFDLRDLSNYSRQGVLDYAAERGLLVDIMESYHPSIPAGIVISQRPAAGTKLRAGDNLSVVISLGPEQVESESSEEPEESEIEEELISSTVSVTIPYVANMREESEEDSDEPESNSSESPNAVEIYIEDVNHDLSTAFRSFTITQDTTVEFNLQLRPGEVGTYRIVRDGEVLEENTVTG